MKLVQYLKNTDFKRMNLQFLSEDSCFFVLKTLNLWIVDIYIEAKHQDLPSYILTLTEFYRFVVKNFRSRIQSERMWTAYAYFLNTMAMVSLRLKQYTKSIEYLEEVAEINETQGVSHCIFSVACANLATLYRRLNDYNTSEYYIGQAIHISKDLMNQMITDRAPSNEII
jgi:tetratricopeptide (TPR) repeat protein